jgi:hypothetical protein
MLMFNDLRYNRILCPECIMEPQRLTPRTFLCTEGGRGSELIFSSQTPDR